ncbi:sodium:solute symporter family protein [Piscinibacter sp. HJYY11]|uniref:sodium:solute symporter family protein n=1 Tax=Piscinibacter sp. HJYY11 TaxID=2801333 RepID=UPI00191DA59B|nr:sodium:solute symporter family protein [Piscinibacter sp. HJYY11]MBL0726744.1 cation acetate symporter [Piscinibacter sp. HJYY11]
MAGPSPASDDLSSPAFIRRLNRVYGAYVLGLLLFIAGLAGLEAMGMSRRWIGAIFLLSTVLLYAGIGVLCRTSEADEYYVAGRRVPAAYNGMATAADWMSAASFISLAGTMYLQGYAGLAFIMGWTGGYCLVALLLAPYLRSFGQYTIPDFLGARYGSHGPRLMGVLATILCSFTYVVAQIYAIGLIASHLVGVGFEIGVFLGLGGILVCSFLGGMRAVTWTQVAQYIVLVVAFLVPVFWLSVKQTGVPVPQLVYGQQLEKVTEREQALRADPRELEVIALYKARAEEYAAKLKDVPTALARDQEIARKRVQQLRAEDAPLAHIQSAEKALLALPRDAETARRVWSQAKAAAEARAQPLGGLPPHGTAYAGDPKGTAAQQRDFDDSRRNFLALVFCLTIGTAALPHLLSRSYTTPSVRQARQSVTWSLFFILLLYLSAPALAVMVKFEVFNVLVGTPFDQLPGWIANWAKVDPGLLSVSDINGDKVLQLGEIRIGSDMVVLATPEIAGLPFVVSGMVAAGALAAALSTADGLLLTISNALSHDVYFKVVDARASNSRRVTTSKMLLLVVALSAAAVAAQKPADIVFLVSAAFSIAASALFPALVLGVFWKRANAIGAVAGMVAGLSVSLYYMVRNEAWMRDIVHVAAPIDLWLGIQPISAGVFGVAASLLVTVAVSLLTPGRPQAAGEFLASIRLPRRPQ